MPTPHHLRNLRREVHKTGHVLNKTHWLGRRSTAGRSQRWGRGKEHAGQRVSEEAGVSVPGAGADDLRTSALAGAEQERKENRVVSRVIGSCRCRCGARVCSASSVIEAATARTRCRPLVTVEREGLVLSTQQPHRSSVTIGVIPCTFKSGHFSSTHGIRSHKKERMHN